MQSWGHVAVGVERQADRAMAEQVLHDLWMDAPCKQMSRSRVPQVMDPDVR